MDDALKWTLTTMTAYTNPEKEHGYNVRHAWGREGHGKGIGNIFPLKLYEILTPF